MAKVHFLARRHDRHLAMACGRAGWDETHRRGPPYSPEGEFTTNDGWELRLFYSAEDDRVTCGRCLRSTNKKALRT
jgi:ribosomal protein S27AE